MNYKYTKLAQPAACEKPYKLLRLSVCALLCATFASAAMAQNAQSQRPSSARALPARMQANPATTQSNGKPIPAKGNTTQIPWGPGNGLSPMTSGGSYAMLTQLQQENILLDQQLKIAQKTKQLQDLEKQDSSSGSSAGSSSGPSLADLAALGGEPRVLLVEGRPGNIKAMISLPSGGTILTRAGDVIPQVGKVISITANTVLVRSSKNKLSAIPFWSSFDSSSASTGASSTGYNVMPPPIPNQSAIQPGQSQMRPSEGVPSGNQP